MPFMRKSSGSANDGSFRAPGTATSDNATGSNSRGSATLAQHPLSALGGTAPPRFLTHRASGPSTNPRLPRSTAAPTTNATTADGDEVPPSAPPAESENSESTSLLGRKRVVFYPVCGGSTQDDLLRVRMEKRKNIDYHQVGVSDPQSAAKKTKTEEGKEEEEEEEGGAPGDGQRKATDPSAAAAPGTITAADGTTTAAPSAEVDEEGPRVIVPLYPVSPYGKLYFQVETEGATRHESVGIVIIDTEEQGVMMYDCLGRQHGNRPEPGYPIRIEEINNAKAGETLRVGPKRVLLTTALLEECFRSGEFFLRSEHDLRRKEDIVKAKAEAAEVEVRARPKMSFGGSTFSSLTLHRRPKEGQTGFIVPLAGRPKIGRNGLLEDLTPLHDPDRANAVVLFRADYKRDLNGRRQVSVVVDPIIGDKLRPHQRQGVKFLFDCIVGERMAGYHGAILADEMGLGKTIQTVATIYTCLRQGKHGVPTARKCLVVTPSSLVKNWCNEFDKWLGEGAVKHFAISESTPKGDRIISRFDGEGDVLVISYDQYRKYCERLRTISGIQLVVCDEGHRLKNSEVKTTKAMGTIPTLNRIILSGTPVQNDLSEFHAMVNYVNPGILGNNDLFNRVFADPISIGRDPDSPDHLRFLGRDRAHYLSILTQKFILRRTQAINESYLPPKVDVTVFVKLGAAQQRAYELLADAVETAGCTPLVLISALRKLCNHMDLFHEAVLLSNRPGGGGRRRKAAEEEEEGDEEEAPRRRGGHVGQGIPLSVLPSNFKPGDLTQSSGSKLFFVSQMLDELRRNGDRDKIVIVSNFTQTLDIIAALCNQKRIGYFQLDGSTPIKKRQELVDYFNVPNSQEIVFLLSSKAGGVGLNLIGANRLILFDPDWNPANDAQAMGRVWRDGQKKRVYIYRLLSTGTIEEKIYQRQVSKQGLSANVVDMQEDSKQHFTLEELRALFKYKHDTLSETHDLLDCTTCEAALSDAQLQSSLARAKRKVEETPMKFKKVASGEKKKKSGPRMDELKAWRHVSALQDFTLDKVLQVIAKAAPSLMSFVFADERDNTQTKVVAPQKETKGKKSKQATDDTALGGTSQIAIEKPFEDDEESIFCASQAALQEEESEMDIEIHMDEEEEEDE